MLEILGRGIYEHGEDPPDAGHEATRDHQKNSPCKFAAATKPTAAAGGLNQKKARCFLLSTDRKTS
jgi:hypothetical protein